MSRREKGWAVRTPCLPSAHPSHKKNYDPISPARTAQCARVAFWDGRGVFMLTNWANATGLKIPEVAQGSFRVHCDQLCEACMKWIRRKPNMRVHGWSFIASIMVLVCAVAIVSNPQAGYSSFVGSLLRTIIGAGGESVSSGHPPSCYVRETDEGLQVIGDGSTPVDADWHYKWRPFYVYTLYESKYGFFAPTHKSIRHNLAEPIGRQRSYPTDFQAYSDQYGLGLTPDENGQLTVDAQLRQFNNYSEDRTLWSGYVINVIAILAVFWIIWSLRWAPRQIRYQIQKRRYLRGLCPLCKYNVCATPDKCPECGWVHGGRAGGA